MKYFDVSSPNLLSLYVLSLPSLSSAIPIKHQKRRKSPSQTNTSCIPTPGCRSNSPNISTVDAPEQISLETALPTRHQHRDFCRQRCFHTRSKRFVCLRCPGCTHFAFCVHQSVSLLDILLSLPLVSFAHCPLQQNTAATSCGQACVMDSAQDDQDPETDSDFVIIAVHFAHRPPGHRPRQDHLLCIK